MEIIKSTTVLAVNRFGKTAIAADGQVTLGNTVFKNNAVKIRKIYKDRVVAGFAGSVTDALTLFENFESKINKNGGDLLKSAVELSKEWRSDKYLRKLEASIIVANNEKIFVINGTGEVIEPDTGMIAIGSGGSYAYASALALTSETTLSAREIAKKSLEIASKICIYTNNSITVEEV